MSNPYADRRNTNKIGKAGRVSESLLAKKLQGRLTPASGAMDGAKGDIHLKEFLIEAKSTVHDSFVLKRDILCKIQGEALREGKLPVVCISFVTGNGRPKVDGEWALIRLKDFQEYVQSSEVDV